MSSTTTPDYAKIYAEIIEDHTVRDTIVFALECSFLVAALGITFLSCYQVICSKKFHINLRILLVNQFIASMLYTIVRILLAIDRKTNYHFLPTRIFLIANDILAVLPELFIINLIMMLIERSQSTWKCATYESDFSYKKSIILLLTPWISTPILMWMLTRLVQSVLVYIIIIFVFVIISMMCMAILYYLNKRKLDKYSLDTTLTERFQVQENISTMQFLAALCLSYSAQLLLIVLPTGLLLTRISYGTFLLLVSIFEVATAFSCFASAVVFLPQLFKRRTLRIHSRISANAAEVEGELYFEQLRRQWT